MFDFICIFFYILGRKLLLPLRIGRIPSQNASVIDCNCDLQLSGEFQSGILSNQSIQLPTSSLRATHRFSSLHAVKHLKHHIVRIKQSLTPRFHFFGMRGTNCPSFYGVIPQWLLSERAELSAPPPRLGNMSLSSRHSAVMPLSGLVVCIPFHFILSLSNEDKTLSNLFCLSIFWLTLLKLSICLMRDSTLAVS